MPKYIIRRVFTSIPIILGVLTVTFFVINLTPGDPLAMYVNPEISPGIREIMAERFGLNDPLPIRYFKWIKNFLTGDFGHSYSHNRPVKDVLFDAVPHTLLLSSTSLLLSIITGIAIGVVSALKKYTIYDHLVTVLSFFIYAMPSFWLALMLIIIFSLKLRLLPASNVRSIDADTLTLLPYLWNRVQHAILPVFVLAIGNAASKGRYMRSSLLEVIRQDYIRTARSKGLPEFLVIWKHAMRNALIPIVTIAGLSIPFLLSGSLIVEVIFAWPGMGQVIINSIFNRDYPLVMATTFISAVMVIFGNLVADVFYSVLDPRIRFD
ncbi:MAG: diguanylate cyclase [Candidatus Cloacimonetes bacterium 4572_55]|nr:MAG: diguanylate cyclase [Candidatus Cloacimonetes bacterium 4572_55]